MATMTKVPSIKKTILFVPGVSLTLGKSAPIPKNLRAMNDRLMLIGDDGTIWVAVDGDGEYIKYRKILDSDNPNVIH